MAVVQTVLRTMESLGSNCHLVRIFALLWRQVERLGHVGRWYRTKKDREREVTRHVVEPKELWKDVEIHPTTIEALACSESDVLRP